MVMCMSLDLVSCLVVSRTSKRRSATPWRMVRYWTRTGRVITMSPDAHHGVLRSFGDAFAREAPHHGARPAQSEARRATGGFKGQPIRCQAGRVVGLKNHVAMSAGRDGVSVAPWNEGIQTHRVGGSRGARARRRRAHGRCS